MEQTFTEKILRILEERILSIVKTRLGIVTIYRTFDLEIAITDQLELLGIRHIQPIRKQTMPDIIEIYKKRLTPWEREILELARPFLLSMLLTSIDGQDQAKHLLSLL